MRQTPVTLTFLILCLIITGPGIFSQTYFEWFNSELPHEYFWQTFTMPFQHGAKGQPVAILIHLMLNISLLLLVGREVERLLGESRFLILSIVAWIAYLGIQSVTGLWINGASGIIWAYSPFLLVIIKKARNNPLRTGLAERSKVLLVIMWGIITIAMGFVPLIFNPNHDWIDTFIYGNQYHATATMVGFVFYFFWKKNTVYQLRY